MESKELLETVIKDRLETANSKTADAEVRKSSFREAMDGIDRLIELEKTESSKKEQRFSPIIKFIEVGAIPAGLLVIDFLCKRSHTTRICNFEKDYTFTTTPGRSLSGLFRFKK